MENVLEQLGLERPTLKMCIQNTSTSTYLCQQCEKSFITSGNLKTHKEKVHGGGSPLPCPHCGKSFQYMESRIKNVHEIRSDVFNCEECDKDEKESAVNKNDRKYDITDQQSDEKPNSIEDILELEYLTPVYHCVLSPAQHSIVLPSPALRAVFACCVHYREWSRKYHHPVLATHSQGVHHLG